MTKASSLDLPFESPSDTTRADDEAPLSVSELLGFVTETLESQFSQVLVLGELTSFKRAPSGHCYFTLSDERASVDAVMFRGQAARVTFDPRPGDEVVCRGKVGLYTKQGRMQLYVQAMRPVGAGAAQRALEELKRKLAGEGLFDPARKKPLPYLPRTIGVVTSRAGAALHDILTTIRRRFRHVRVVLSPAVVQGAEAPGELVAALGALAELGGCDVVIIGRGGGAAEDLAAFNDERVVRAVAAFPTPIVSAVGHEVDTSLCDLAADLRAATPTAAAEAVVPVHAELAEQAAMLDARLGTSVVRHLENLRHRVGDVGGRLRDPAARVAGERQRTDELLIRLERALFDRHRAARTSFDGLQARMQHVGREYAAGVLERLRDLEQAMHRAAAERTRLAERSLGELRSKLDALSPLAVLERGYSLTTRDDGVLVRSSADIAAGDTLALRFHSGHAKARVLSTSTEDEE